MQLTEIVNNLHITEDKKLFFKAYKLWCNILYNKYGISDELLEVFIKDITEADKVFIHEDTVIAEGNDFRTVVINSCNRTATSFDGILNKFINENS